jgi:hypothetical protein
MFGVTEVKGEGLQSILDKATQKLTTAETNFCYRNNFGISIFQLVSKNNGFDLGISQEAHSQGPVGNYASGIISFLTGESDTDSRIATKGVNTNSSQVKTSKLAYQHNFWYSHICRQIRNLLDGDLGAVNAVVYPLAKHTFKEKAYKPCISYVQYQLHQTTNTLNVVINFRAQHLYMLAFNIQLWAFQLLQLCHEFDLDVGNVVANCTNHHVGESQDPKMVCGKRLPWFVKPEKTMKLVSEVARYYDNLRV